MRSIDISEAIEILNLQDARQKQQKLWELDQSVEFGQAYVNEKKLYVFLTKKTLCSDVERFLAVHDRLSSRFTRRSLIFAGIDRFLAVNDVFTAENLLLKLDSTLLYQGYRKLLRY